MQALTPIEHQSAPAVPPTVKPARISARIRRVAELVITGECQTIKAAAERVGIHPDYAYRELKKPQVQVFCEQRARQTIAAGTMRASARLIGLIDSGSDHVSLDATKHVLGIAGIRPPDSSHGVSVNVGVSVGYVIDLTPGAHQPHAPELRTQIVEHDQ